MDALILDRSFNTQCIIDAFESFIWTDRYREPGDFELYMPVERAPLEYMVEGYYVWIETSDRLMIIEDINITSDAEEGPHVKLTGRTLESLLDRHVVHTRTTVIGTLQSGIKKLLMENAIEPRDEHRVLPGLRFVESTDERVTGLMMNAEYLGEDLLTIVEEQCELNDLGFKIVYNEDEGMFDFSLYFGEDRSYDQEDLPWVVFSSRYDNLLGSNYYESKKELRTAAIVVGAESDDWTQAVIWVEGRPEMTGIDRREMCVDASDIELPEKVVVDEDAIREQMSGASEESIRKAIAAAQTRADSENQTNWNNYIDALSEKGRIELAKTYITEAFEGTIAASIQFIYGRDFFIGDVVQIRDQFGKEAASRVTEVMRSHDVNGETLTPTFTTLLGGSNRGEVTE